MKKFFLFLVCCITALSSFGQSQITDKGLVYSEGGFKIIEVKDTANTYYSEGLYSSDGKVLVMAMHYSSYFYVAYGTEVIAKNAFRYDGGTIYIPSTVKYIDPDAFSAFYKGSSSGYAFYIDDVKTKQIVTDNVSAVSQAKVDNNAKGNAKEVARFNLQGQKLSKPEKGINIVELANNTAKKVLVK
jgi:hypothetical protein